MPRVKQDAKLPIKLKQLGLIYRLIEQFEEISRIDLSKLSQLAPATITALTRELIEQQLVIEKEVQNTETRGRPAVGLCLSPFYWQSLSAILVEEQFTIFLCELNGRQIEKMIYPLTPADFLHLDKVLVDYIEDFLVKVSDKFNHIMTFSIAVDGELNTQNYITRLGKTKLELNLYAALTPHFDIPIVVTEYFQAWMLAESSLGCVIGCDNVLFLQLDDRIRLSVLIDGKILYQDSNKMLNVDRILLPAQNTLIDQINGHLPFNKRNQGINLLSHQSLCRLFDHYYPDNQSLKTGEKIELLCQNAMKGEESAVEILHIMADNLAYLLMNLVHIFSSEKIMVNTSLLGAKDIFLARLNAQLSEYLSDSAHQTEVITGQYVWNDPVVLAAGIKQRIYDGSLLAHFIKE